ncbi:NAD-dependent epimerase/dehydratase family protein [Dictyobacter halimunensis]
MKVLITGALGFIGRALTEYLGQRGHELRLLDIADPTAVSIYNPLKHERETRSLKLDWPFVRGEITDPLAVAEAMRDVEAVVHLGGIPVNIPDQGATIFRTNALGTFVVLDEARKAGVARCICASSVNAFGTFYWRLSRHPIPYTRLPLDEEYPPAPEDPYSLSKLVTEETCAAFHRGYGMTTAALRFTWVWPEEMYQRARGDLKVTDQWHDDLFSWLHVQDAAEGIEQALLCPDLPGYGAYNMCASDTCWPEPTVDLLERFRPDLLPALTRPLQGRESLLSIDKARCTFGFSPRYRLGD